MQADALANDEMHLAPEQLPAVAQQRRKDLEDAREIDWVSDRQPFPTGNGPYPDTNMLDKMLEVRWRYQHTETGEPVYIWCKRLVVKVCAHRSSS